MTPTKRCVCPSPSAGAYSVCRRCGGEYGCTPPKKRTHGQCTCYPLAGEGKHLPDCPALYPLQPHPGDEPDTLTRLARAIRAHADLNDARMNEVLALISEAAEERKALLDERKLLLRRIDAQDTKLAAQQETITALSNKTTEALRMGQQQGRVELATELLGMRAAEALLVLEGIVNKDT